MNPITKWKITPKINTGWRTNWTKGLVPIKWDISLKVSGLKTDVKLIAKCCSKNTIKNIAERAIDIFLAMDVLKNTDICYYIKNLNKCNTEKNVTQEKMSI